MLEPQHKRQHVSLCTNTPVGHKMYCIDGLLRIRVLKVDQPTPPPLAISFSVGASHNSLAKNRKKRRRIIRIKQWPAVMVHAAQYTKSKRRVYIHILSNLVYPSNKATITRNVQPGIHKLYLTAPPGAQDKNSSDERTNNKQKIRITFFFFCLCCCCFSKRPLLACRCCSFSRPMLLSSSMLMLSWHFCCSTPFLFIVFFFLRSVLQSVYQPHITGRWCYSIDTLSDCVLLKSCPKLLFERAQTMAL